MKKLIRPNIIDVAIEHGLDLKRVGNNYFTFCQYHADSGTPNMCLYKDTNSFFCFACRASGTVENLIAKLENKTYYQVVKMLYGDNYEFRTLGEPIRNVELDSSYMRETLSKELRVLLHANKCDIKRAPELISRIVNSKMDMAEFKSIMEDIRNG